METETHEPGTCRHCGGESFVAWYPVDESQGLDIELAEDGTLTFDYNGDTTTGECGPDEAYMCGDCNATASTLEYLLGLAETDIPPTETDGHALDRIRDLLSGREWQGADDMPIIAEIVAATGRTIEDVAP